MNARQQWYTRKMKLFYFLNIIVINFVGTLHQEDVPQNDVYVPKYLQDRYGSGFASHSAGVKTGNVKTGVKTYTKTSVSTKYKGGCDTPPTPPINAELRCSTFSGCRATCIPDFQFPNKQTAIYIACEEGAWNVVGTEWDHLPSCEPICLPECENNGICIAPNQCNCPENFSGPRCQFENKPCLNYPAIPMNSRRSCNPTNCNIMCLPGHEFPDGSHISSMVCKSGSWMPTKENWVSIPDCQPTCNPPCQNGGNCLSFNVCQCPQEFRGSQCQYSIDACSSRRLGFNGGHNCTGSSETFSCSIFCPEGIKFEYPPDPVYVCTYETGIFIPLAIPQCVYEPIYVPYQPINPDPFYRTPGYSIFGSSTPNVVSHIPNLNMNKTSVTSDHFGRTDRNFVTIEEKQPEPGFCLTWGGSHYKTFDGKVFSFNSKCAHTLVQDALDSTFSITVQNSPECSGSPHLCYTITKLYFQNKVFTLKHSETGFPIFMSGTKILPVPARLPGFRVEMSAHFLVVSLDTVNAKLKWDGYQLVQVLIQENLWNRTSGLCGRLDGDASNDLVAKDGTMPKSFTTLGSSWQVDTIGDECNTLLNEEHACQDDGVKDGISEKASQFCSKFLTDPRFAACHSVIDTSVLFNACKWDYCSCKHSDPSLCICETINVYVKVCTYKGIKTLTKWRDENTCPMKCTGGRVYMPCAPKDGQEVCGASVENAEDEDTCEEGCYCPKGTVLHDSVCITRDKCPCRLRGKNFAPDSTVDKECNTCTCTDGQWICTQVSCGARCSAIGDPHYSTFDGKRYDFMGQCSYYLVKADNFSIEAENVACAGAISLAMNFPISVTSGLPSCTKTITINIAGQHIKLKQNHEVSVNEKELTKLPYNVAGVGIRSVSSIFVVVELPNGFQIWWDGLTRVYVNAPAAFKGKTKGLCGTFNDNQKDDFLTPENDIEMTVIPFANKWKTIEKCNDVPDKLKSHPCDVNVQNRATAEQYCKKIKSNLFGDCHWYVDPEPFYQDCLYDMCSCEVKLSNCLCPMVAAYAHECALKKIRIDWRNDIKECGVHCPGGQKYQVCGNSCTRTCYDVATRPDCKETCVEGCTCPEGETLDEHGDCIPIGQCKCQHEGLEFASGYKEVRPASKGQELCVCINANWNCRLATPDEIKNHPQASDIKSKCDASKNFVFTTCESPEQVTCKNMHSEEGMISVGVCHAGCECKEGYVFNRNNGTCVRPSECPCHHGGRSYGEKSVVQNDCNTCVCENGKWKCTDRQCSAECSSWGDSHFKTFDGRMYDYQGQCDYALAKGILSSEDMFDISIQNVPCGSLGVSCSKSITIKVGSGLQQEHITLTRHKTVPHTQIFKRFTLRTQDLFVIVEAADIGLIVLWDKGTRVYVKVDPRWKNKLKGLCGNYNDNELDDFQTPSGGVTEVSAQLFGDSWKLQSYCPEAVEIRDTCEQRPNRRVWAVKQCGILKTSDFALCHSEVPVDKYYEACVFDSCACDQGGDCECLCTAIAAYVHECNGKGMPIKWRSQELCPIQCDERCAQYSPCVSTCPLETCDNLLVQNPLSKLCKEDACVEGCAPKPCPPEFVYLNSSYTECVPRNTCKPFCLEVNGIIYYEGDLIKEDECHSCFCSRGKETCTGQPCPEVTTTPYVPTTLTTKQPPPGYKGAAGMYGDRGKCRSGWTGWINQDKAAPYEKTVSYTKPSDVEPLPNTLVMNKLRGKNKCNSKDIIDIECRTVRDHVSYKETGLDVECSLEKGLICKSGLKPCTDFEIRVLCQCEEKITITTPSEYTTYISTPGEYAPCNISQPNQEIPNDCHGFYHCVPGLNGTDLVEKTCGSDKMYNPTTQVCDWPSNVILIKPECGRVALYTTEPGVEIIEPSEECLPGQKYESCAIECDKLCQFYSQTVKENGHCHGNNSKCEEGCVPETHKPCPGGTYAASETTCVPIQDCICLSSDGNAVKPSTVYKEDCKVCQCINNFYSCDESACKQEITSEISITSPESVSELPAFVVTVTPPQECLPDMFINLIQGDQPLPDEAFSASSVYGSSFEPKYAKLDNQAIGMSGGSWKPDKSDKHQYLQIDLGRQEPVYGVIVQGSPLYSDYVTSYKVSYSSDKSEQFSYVLNEKTLPQVFRGSVDTNTPVKQLFYQPVEAEVIRIHPLTWHNDIALRVELIGCNEIEPTTVIQETTSTAEIPEPTKKRIKVKKYNLCKDPMGFDNGMMSDQQVSVSSEFSPAFSKKHLKLSEDNAWQPLINSRTEWIEFNFLEPRNITGIKTTGGPDGWVTAYNMKYSHNEKDWSPILDEEFDEKTFLGNFDHDSLHTNMFDLPILTTFIKVIPLKWHSAIQVKVEPLGCFEPYPPVEELTTISQPCQNCPGISSDEVGTCHCTEDLWWNGENCIARNLCPCMVGHIPYTVGTKFQKEDCSSCLCKIGGNALCTPKKCEKCDKGLKSTVTSTCGCLCLPCEDDKILCPSSDICINATQWCNGIEDCPDDEIDCPTTPGLLITTTTPEPKIRQEEAKKITCQKPNCSSGYKVVMKSSSKTSKYTMFSPFGRKTQYAKSYLGIKTRIKGGVKNEQKLVLQKPPHVEKETVHEKEECAEFECVSTRPPPPPYVTGKPQIGCPLVLCPPEYNIQIMYENLNEACPRYECIPPPPPDAVCNVTGRTFNTFDGTEYKYDICNHVLARDLENDEWDISLKKSCEKVCTRHLIIHQQEHTFSLYPNSTVEYDGYKYTVSQTKKIGSQSQAFTITRLGDTLLFVSNRYGFWVIWDDKYNVKVGVSTKLLDKVDGLCGFYNNNPTDDKRKPDGKKARTTSEFGDSWGQAEQPLECETKVCPIHVQNEAWAICNKVKDETLAPCAKEVDIQSFISRCLETTCACLQTAKGNHTKEENCRCQTLQSFIADCMQASSSVELTDWRLLHDCPVTCPAPLIHHDCYRRPCEPTCETISDPNACRKLDSVCFPGCYCPPGLVRKGESCVKPSTCRDCECNVLPHLQYVTYDNANFTVNGNCVYVMSRDEIENEKDSHKFQVLVTNAPCEGKENKMCVGKVTILFEGHKIHIYRDNYGNRLKLIVDGDRIDDFSEIQAWAEVIQSKAKHLKILLKQVQVEVSVYFPSLGVSVKAPSHKYGGKLEGLCGNCNKNPEDDLKTPNGKRPDNIEEFGLSWLYDKLPGQTKENCAPVPEPTCQALSSEADPCQQLLDSERFGQCHLLLDPTMFVEWCYKDICGGNPEQACLSIGTYANQCLHSNICVNWHSNLCPAEVCPPEKIYNQCGTNCPKTCDNIKEKESKCEEIPVDGCFCPEGKVLLNNTCVEPRECEVCDEEGHHPGDTWQKDACTTCSCVGTTLNCETKHCPNTDTICEEGYNSVKLPSDGKQCCDKYVCVPAPTQGPTCEPPQQLQCSSGQIMKLITSADGCQKFICECKPIEDCEPIETSTDLPLEDGIEKIINHDDCCPTVKKVCNINLCRPSPDCPTFYTLKKTEIPEKCCPVYDCVAPKKCIVYLNYTSAENGGERVRNEYDKQKLLKEVDEIWADGPCRQCRCIGNLADGYFSTCAVKDCPLLIDSPDKEDFILESEKPAINQCCSTIKRVACVHNGKTYKVGEKWQVEGDYCTEMECASTEKGLQKLTEKTVCDTSCKAGYEYVPSPPSSKQCCGSCKCVACIVDGIERKIGETWSSPDFCSTFVCLNVNDSAQVQEAKVSCLGVSLELEEFVYETHSIPGECCKKHKPVACKVGNVTYKVGEIWPSPDLDKCKNVTCVENTIGELTKQESVKTCNRECGKGWEYKDSISSCCGECVPTACVVDNEIKMLGETWTSLDKCITYTCEQLGDQFLVLSEQESCPTISDCKPENVYMKGCCQHCNMTMESQKDCAAVDVNPEITIGLVKITKAFSGICTNKSPLPGFIECVGLCKSAIEFSAKTASFESSCSCCRATNHKPIITELICEDGSKLLKQISLPAACSCSGCVSEEHASLIKSPTKTHTKTGVKTGVKGGVKTGVKGGEKVNVPAE